MPLEKAQDHQRIKRLVRCDAGRIFAQRALFKIQMP